MSDQLRDILLSGFSIFPSNGKFIIRKESVENSEFTLSDKECDSYSDAIEYAIEMMKKPRIRMWQAIVRYNRGLGIEYKNLQNIETETFEQAIEVATLQAESLFKGQKVCISEIKVRLKSNK